MTITNKRSLIALLIALVLVVSLFTIGISADETTTETAENTTTESTTTSKTESSSSSEETTTSGETTMSEAQKQAIANTKKTLIINAIIIGVIIAILVACVIKFRTKLGGFLRSVKSELKKIVWSSKENTRKSFFVVIIVAIAIALLLFIVDFAFKSGLGMLRDLIK